MASAESECGSFCQQQQQLLDLPTEILLHIVDQLVTEVFQPSTTPRQASACLALLALRWSCRSFHAMTPDPGPHMIVLRQSLAHKLHDAETKQLLTLESWPEYSITPAILSNSANSIHAIGTQPGQQQHSDDAPWASKTKPVSRHACHICFALLPSSCFAWVQITGARAKRPAGSADDSESARSDTAAGQLGSKAHRRFCIQCGIQSLQYNDRTPVMRIVEDWEGQGRFATGIVCKRCHRFILTAADSVTALRRKCERCREYRPP